MNNYKDCARNCRDIYECGFAKSTFIITLIFLIFPHQSWYFSNASFWEICQKMKFRCVLHMSNKIYKVRKVCMKQTFLQKKNLVPIKLYEKCKENNGQ